MTLIASAAWSQRTVVSGKVVDAATGRAVAGASVRSGGLSVVTNDDGFFVLKSDSDLTTVTASHIGYRAATVTVTGQQLALRLQPTPVMLSEVLVMADNPREVVMAAVSRIPRNYSQQPEGYQCFYREKAMKRQHYVCVAEGVVDMYKTGYGRSSGRDRVAIRKGRRLLSPRRGDTLSVKVLGGPVAPVQLDVVKNTELLLTADELDCYDLKMETPTSIGDRLQYVVRLMPRRVMPYALYFGKLFIDQQTLAFTRAELSLDMSDRQKATDQMLIRKPAGVRFRPKELSLLIDFRLDDDGKTRMSYLRTTFRFNCDWKRRLLATSFAAFCEMAVTSTNGTDVQPIGGRESFDQRDAFFDKVDFFRDPLFWQNYNIIEPTESLDRAVHKLLKKF
jgi:hypothetical protein